jgi:hypothetical protein
LAVSPVVVRARNLLSAADIVATERQNVRVEVLVLIPDLCPA